MAKFGRGGSWLTVDANAPDPLGCGPHSVQRVSCGDGIREVSIPDFTGRVHIGMDVLDEAMPGWQLRLNQDVLDLADEHSCVLGQTWLGFKGLVGDVADTITEASNFEKMAIRLAQRSGEEQIYAFAGTIGCCLTATDHESFNLQAKKMIITQMGPQLADTTVGQTAMTKLGEQITAAAYSALTETWIREVNRARVAGRWGSVVLPPVTRQPTAELLTV